MPALLRIFIEKSDKAAVFPDSVVLDFVLSDLAENAVSQNILTQKKINFLCAFFLKKFGAFDN